VDLNLVVLNLVDLNTVVLNLVDLNPANISPANINPVDINLVVLKSIGFSLKVGRPVDRHGRIDLEAILHRMSAGWNESNSPVYDLAAATL